MSAQTIANLYGLKGKKLQRQYRDYLSEFTVWDKLKNSSTYLIYPENVGKRLSIDEVALSQGELIQWLLIKKQRDVQEV